MIAAWMLYSTGVAVLLGIAAAVVEPVLRRSGVGARWGWAVALAMSLTLSGLAWYSPAASEPRTAVEGSNPDAGPAVQLSTTEAALDPVVTGGPGIAGVAGMAAPETLTTAIPVGVLAAGDEPARWLPEFTEGSLGAFRQSTISPWLDLLTKVEPLAGYVWLAVSLLFLALVCAGQGRLAQRRKRWWPAAVAGANVLVSVDTGPAAVGIIRTEIVVPRWVLGLKRPLQSLLVAHEQEHVRAGDARLVAWSIAALIVMPWNPALWWQASRLRSALEVDCDARVLRRTSSRRTYAELLLEVAGRRPERRTFAPALVEPSSLLERRIRLMTERPPRRWMPRAIGSAGLTAALVVLAAGAPRPAMPSAHPPAEPFVPMAAAGSNTPVPGGDSPSPSMQTGTPPDTMNRLAVCVATMAFVSGGCSGLDGRQYPDFAHATGHLQEELRIDGWAEEWTPIDPIGVAVSSEGVIAVAGFQDAFVRLYAPTGELLGRFGREGEGPGEFRPPGIRTGWHGDTLWVYNASRMTLVSPELELMRTSTRSLMPVLGIDPGGSLVVLDIDFPQDTWRIRHITQEATVGDIIVTLPQAENARTSRDTSQPFRNEPFYDVAPDGSRVGSAMATLTGPDAGSFQLVNVSLEGDTLFDRRYAFRMEPLAAAVGDSVVEAFASRIEAGGMGVHAATLRAEAFIPPIWPPLTRLLMGRDGSTWIRMRPLPEGQPYYVVSPDGTPVGTVVVPARSHVAAAHLDRIWVLEPDEFDVQSLARYVVTWPS